MPRASDVKSLNGDNLGRST